MTETITTAGPRVGIGHGRPMGRASRPSRCDADRTAVRSLSGSQKSLALLVQLGGTRTTDLLIHSRLLGKIKC